MKTLLDGMIVNYTEGFYIEYAIVPKGQDIVFDSEEQIENQDQITEELVNKKFAEAEFIKVEPMSFTTKNLTDVPAGEKALRIRVRSKKDDKL